MRADAQRLAARYLKKAGMSRIAGEVRFIKDRGGDKNEWGWGSPGPSEREVGDDFEFNAKNLKPLSLCLRSTLAAMGHSLSAYDTFTRIKSAMVSPDGSLGGKGYIQRIADMRRQYMNCVEALSALSDTLYDEIHAPHWLPAKQDQSPRERDEVREILQDVNTIRENPEEWAAGEEQEMDEEGANGQKKLARMLRRGSRNWANSSYYFDQQD
jgi:hypothetical protein